MLVIVEISGDSTEMFMQYIRDLSDGGSPSCVGNIWTAHSFAKDSRIPHAMVQCITCEVTDTKRFLLLVIDTGLKYTIV